MVPRSATRGAAAQRSGDPAAVGTSRGAAGCETVSLVDVVKRTELLEPQTMASLHSSSTFVGERSVEACRDSQWFLSRGQGAHRADGASRCLSGLLKRDERWYLVEGDPAAHATFTD